jgi:hypothetical protein
MAKGTAEYIFNVPEPRWGFPISALWGKVSAHVYTIYEAGVLFSNEPGKVGR